MKALKNLSPTHPRLFLSDAETPAWRKRIQQSDILRPVAEKVVENADAILEMAPEERELVGRRMLESSRIVLKRMVTLSMAHRLTEEKKYADRAVREMLTAADYVDWNPSHFLDTAEMTAALALGYDWLYAEMDEAEREKISAAILEKGLRPSLPDPETGKTQGWLDAHNNWNQVCNAGMTLGALALYEKDPGLTAQLLDRAVASLPLVMSTYAPHGAYVEGATYWSYGSTFNVLFLDAVTHALGTDFGLTATPGFLESAEYKLHIVGPGGHYFNYADSGSRAPLQPAMYWMAARSNQTGLLWRDLDLIRDFLEKDPRKGKSADRLTPFLLLWAPENLERKEPEKLHWHGDGKMPVAFHRTDWSPDATFFGIKGGSPSLSHAHMDVGSFVLEIDGVRWAVDPGGEDYHEVEKRGLNLWSTDQDSDRWRISRIGSFSHNILTVNGEHQRVEGNAPVLGSEGPPAQRTVLDLSSVYKGQLASVRRGMGISGPRRVTLTDTVEALEKAAGDSVRIRWAMVTRAEIEFPEPRRALLRQDGKRLEVTLEGPGEAIWEEKDLSRPPMEWESPNPGTRLLFFEADIPAGAQAEYRVTFQGVSV